MRCSFELFFSSSPGLLARLDAALLLLAVLVAVLHLGVGHAVGVAAALLAPRALLVHHTPGAQVSGWDGLKRWENVWMGSIESIRTYVAP